MKSLLLLCGVLRTISVCAALLVALTACVTNPIKPEPVVVVEKEYVVRIPPKDLTELPAPVPKMDLDDQGEVAKWIVLQMERMSALENKLIGIAKFLKDDTQDK